LPVPATRPAAAAPATAAATGTGSGPAADDTGVTFSLPDRTRRFDGVRLVQEIGLTDDLTFSREGGTWTLRLPRPGVDRMEYLLETTDRDGATAMITDPGNPLRAGGAFGDKSVVLFPGYRQPTWLELPPAPESTHPVSIQTRALGSAIDGVLWSPDGLDPRQPTPLVVVHDGPEYARIGSFTHYLGALVAAGALPPLRAVLLAPGDRNVNYAANRAYARALCAEFLPKLDGLAPATLRIGVGVSLGALAILHAHRSFPSAFDALLLQSGSFFTPKLDAQEREFSGFEPVTEFVARLARSHDNRRPLPTVMTCGAVEENLANNKNMAELLRGLDYPVDFHVVRDGHNYTAWRDALDPPFTDLLRDLAGAHAA
jgi:enterochelin esterase-like enzyme